MTQTAAHLVGHIIAHVPVRQWVLALPIPLRLLLTAQAKLVTPALQVVHHAMARFLLDHAGLKADEAHSGAVTLIQRFGSDAKLNIHLHCLVLDGVYRCGANDCEALEQHCPYISRPVLANERVQSNADGQVVLKLKTPWREGSTQPVKSPLEFMQRPASVGYDITRDQRGRAVFWQ